MAELSEKEIIQKALAEGKAVIIIGESAADMLHVDKNTVVIKRG